MDPYPLAKKLLFRMDAEKAHHLTLRGMRTSQNLGLLQALAGAPAELNQPVEAFGLTFPNAVGLAAGMDKEGAAVDAFGALGFGHVEIGTVTPRPQPGNNKPRLFRLPEHEAIINRMGFNNCGLEGVLANLAKRKSFQGILGVNLGKNFDTPNEQAVDDYLIGLRGFYGEADYLVVNLSSPNTKGLRDLQSIDSCREILERLQAERAIIMESLPKYKPILVKLAPDLADDQAVGLAEMFGEIQVDGVIATNTTLDRSKVAGHPLADEAGGLSGRPLTERSLECLKVWRQALDPKIPIVSVGGIFSGADAKARLDAGATLVQVYTGLIYRGPALVREILEAVRK